MKSYSMKKIVPNLVIVALGIFFIIGSGGGSGNGSDGNDSNTSNSNTTTITPSITFSSDRTEIIQGKTVTLKWTVTNATSVIIEPDIGLVENTGSREINPFETTTYILTATDESGEGIAKKEVTIVVNEQLALGIKSNITSGTAPLTVRFSPDPQTTNAINRYYWDFEGDGGDVDAGLGKGENGFDRVRSVLNGRLIDFDVTGRDQVFIFQEPGNYVTRLLVQDADGQQELTSIPITVTNDPPDVQVFASPSNGQVPLRVNFTVSMKDDTGVQTIEVDYDGDGKYDENIDGNPSRSEQIVVIQHLYEAAGSYQASVRVTDPLGKQTIASFPHMEIRPAPIGSSAISLSANIVNGKVPLSVNFTARPFLQNGETVTKLEWDFDGDGVFDKTGTATESHQYITSGKFYPHVKMTTSSGFSAIDILEIVVDSEFSLRVTTPSINPEQNESANILFTLGEATKVAVKITDKNGDIVRDLLAEEERLAGEHTLSWDGRNNEGNILAPDPYYAVMTYVIDGETKTLDLRTTTGGDLFYPVSRGRSCARGLDPCGSLSIPSFPLEPFAFKPWVFEYDIPYNAEMDAYMTIYTTNEVVNTFYLNKLIPAGVHQITWNGEGTNGRLLAEAPTRYLITLLGHTLPDNTIFLSHTAKISNMRLDKAIFYPSMALGQNGKKLNILFDLTKAATVNFIVQDLNSGVEVLKTTGNAYQAGTDLQFVWNGRNADDVLLAPSAYIVSLEAVDSSGLVSDRLSHVIRIKF